MEVASGVWLAVGHIAIITIKAIEEVNCGGELVIVWNQKAQDRGKLVVGVGGDPCRHSFRRKGVWQSMREKDPAQMSLPGPVH